MRRTAMEKLVAWKSSDERKPMVLKGARQVGKTWLMKEFGKNYYKSFVYFNFDEEDELKSIFETNKNPQRIIELLSMIAGEKIHPLDTLVIFDEVQECPEALNALKYFKEKANEYHVIAAGSLLGTLLAKPKSYPVGMVNLLDIFPLNFEEFLEATDAPLFAYYEGIHKEQQIEEIFHNRLLEAYNNYLIIGGMPECVSSWLKQMAGIDNSAILLKSTYQFKGQLTENYVLQQLRGQFDVMPRYFSSRNGEIDFVLQYGMDIIPVETKGGEDKSAPTFKKYVADNHPQYAVRFSKMGYRKDGNITNIPLYLVGKTKELLGG